MKTITLVYLVTWLFLFVNTRNMYKYESMRGVPDPPEVTSQLKQKQALPYVTAGLPLLFIANGLMYIKKRKKSTATE